MKIKDMKYYAMGSKEFISKLENQLKREGYITKTTKNNKEGLVSLYYSGVSIMMEKNMNYWIYRDRY